MNTTDSAVRITHLPTGIVVVMQDEKSQIQNRAKALQVLRARLLKLEQDRQAAELSEQRRGQIGGGGRSEKIRTYNFKENRVTDHRIGLTMYKLDKVLAGELDEFVDALIADERARQLGGERTDRAPARRCAADRGSAEAERGRGAERRRPAHRRAGLGLRRRRAGVLHLDEPAPQRAVAARRRHGRRRRGRRAAAVRARRAGASAASTSTSTGGC